MLLAILQVTEVGLSHLLEDPAALLHWLHWRPKAPKLNIQELEPLNFMLTTHLLTNSEPQPRALLGTCLDETKVWYGSAGLSLIYWARIKIATCSNR